MHYSYDDIVAASTDLGQGYRKAVITLAEGDTASSQLSAKWDFGGPGTVEYLIHKSGWTITPSDTIYKHYR